MSIVTTPFDAAAFLGDVDIQVEMLSDAFVAGDPGMVAHVLGVIARARGITALGNAADIPRSTLYKALAPDGNPTVETLFKIVRALDLELSVNKKAA